MIKIYNNKSSLKSELKEFRSAIIKAIIEIIKILEIKNNIDFCIIGGIAGFLVYEQIDFTRDIDILVNNNNFEKMSKLENIYFESRESGLKLGETVHFKWFKPECYLDILFSGWYFVDSKIVMGEPKDIKIYNHGIPFIKLEKLIEYKCGSNRIKDWEAVKKLIKNNHLEKNYADNFNGLSKITYQSIWDQ